jgi:hypothetical protein
MDDEDDDEMLLSTSEKSGTIRGGLIVDLGNGFG